jgi:hypothetical protein
VTVVDANAGRRLSRQPASTPLTRDDALNVFRVLMVDTRRFTAADFQSVGAGTALARRLRE